MNLESRVSKIKRESLARIETAARSGDTTPVIAYTRLVEESESLFKRVTMIQGAVEALEKKFTRMTDAKNLATVAEEAILDETLQPTDRREALEKAAGYREAFIKDVGTKGVQLERKRGKSVFVTNNGATVGIAFASENNRNRWWLALPIEENYASIVFLCETREGSLITFILPKGFVDERSAQFTTSARQVQFNVLRKDGKYFLSLPDGQASIDDYIVY